MFRFVMLCFALLFLEKCESYRILGVFPLSGKSHDMIFESLMVGLAKRGHQVDVVTHFPVKNPPQNYHNIVNLNGTLECLINNFTMDFVTSMAGDEVDLVSTLYGNRLCHLMGLPEMQQVLRNPPNDPPYDLVITETFGANCYLALGQHFGVPVVGVSSAVEYPWVAHFTGNSDNLAFVPNALFMAFGKMSFWQRLQNVLINYDQVKRFHAHTEDAQTEAMRKYLNPNMPDIREVEKSTALILVNSHPVLFGVKPITSGLIQIAGLHIEERDTTLPKDLKKWMDESSDGVIYFTFGSMVLVETLPKDTILALYGSFAKIAPIRVLMKIADKTKLPPGLPTNVHVSPWIPQQAVLAHENVKAFITHGGLMGSLEALYYGVPMIGIPLFADQPRNVEAFVVKNMTVKLLLKDLTEENLDSAISKVLNDPKYRLSAKYFSKLFRDRPMSAMDTAVFWIEYVVRNGGNVLKSPALSLTWWQLALLDVYGFIFLVCLVLLLMLYKILGIIANILFNFSNEEDKDKKHK